jgi:hypothetical protein
MLEDNTIYIYSINNLNTPITINNIITTDEIPINKKNEFYVSNSATKIAYLYEFSAWRFNICLIDLKLNTHIIIKLEATDHESYSYGFYTPWCIISFSPDETMLLTHSSLNIIIYNTIDGSTIYRLDMTNIISVVWHPFESTIIFLRREENIFYENNINYNDGYMFNDREYIDRYVKDNCYLYKCNIYTDKELYRLNNIKYTIIQLYKNNFTSMIFSQDGSELIIPCNGAIVIHKINNFNEVYKFIVLDKPRLRQVRINY